MTSTADEQARTTRDDGEIPSGRWFERTLDRRALADLVLIESRHAAGSRLPRHAMLGVPAARSISPITKTDWEGTVVVPNVNVAAADALTTATTLALEALAKSAKSR